MENNSSKSKKKISLSKEKKFYPNIAKNLKKLMLLANISESELSRRTNVRQPIIHRLLSGENKNPKLLTMKPLADYFMLSLSEFIGEKDVTTTWKGYTSNNHFGWNEIPLFNEFQILEIDKYKPTKFIISECKVSKRAFAMNVSDQSMEPLFLENCKVIVEPELLPQNNNYIIIQIYNTEKPILRHFIKNHDGNFINAFNNKFDTIRKISIKDRIIGTVIRTIYDHKINE